MKKWINWRCECCGAIIQGKIDEDGDFLAIEEINKKFPAVGCKFCGSMTGEVEQEEELV